jgi:hypothetical protein
MAEVAMAVAAVTYPIVRVVNGYLERRAEERDRRYAAPAEAVEARLTERCTELEERLAKVEQVL